MRMPVFAAVAFFVALTVAAAGENEEGKWIQLFNGKDLAGWTPKFQGYDLGVNYKNTFRVADGLLTVSYDEYEKFDEKFGHLFYEKPFSAPYRLRGVPLHGRTGTRGTGLGVAQ